MAFLIVVIVALVMLFYWRPALVITAVILMALIGIGLHTVVQALPEGVTSQTFSVASRINFPTP